MQFFCYFLPETTKNGNNNATEEDISIGDLTIEDISLMAYYDENLLNVADLGNQNRHFFNCFVNS